MEDASVGLVTGNLKGLSWLGGRSATILLSTDALTGEYADMVLLCRTEGSEEWLVVGCASCRMGGRMPEDLSSVDGIELDGYLKGASLPRSPPGYIGASRGVSGSGRGV